MSAKRKKQKTQQADAAASPKKIPEKEVVGRVRRLTGPVCEMEGLELVHVEYQREPRGRILRLYIDRPGGVTLDDCVDISRQLSDLLDVSLEELGPYHLEVSSPGLNRPLGQEKDFERFRGEKAKIRTARLLDGQRSFTGILAGMSEGNVLLECDSRTVSIPYDEITRARLVKSL